MNLVVIEAPTNLGLKPTGVELMASTLLDKYELGAGLYEKRIALTPPAYRLDRDADTRIMNGPGIVSFSHDIADVVEKAVCAHTFPLVLGGDCSIVLGCMLGMRRTGQPGLLYIDGHSDCYPPKRSPTGEVADMALGLAVGKGPDVLANMQNFKQYVAPEHAVAFGYRDTEQAMRDGASPSTYAHIKNAFHLRRYAKTALAGA
jgi:arginase